MPCHSKQNQDEEHDNDCDPKIIRYNHDDQPPGII